LIIIVAFLIIGLYRLLYSLTGKIFLKKYIITFQSKGFPENEIEALLSEFKATRLTPYPTFDSDIRNLKNEYGYYIPLQKNKEIYKLEKDMIDIKARLKVFYD